MTSNLDLWKLLAGLGIFLFGMHQLEDAIKAMSGKVFRRLVSHWTRGRWRAVGSGTLVTAILQSSSAVSLMVLAFVGAGVLSLENGIGVMLGANVGTTITAWIIGAVGFQLKIESFALPFIAAGGLLLAFNPSAGRLFQIARLLLGFGFLLLGVAYMKGGVENLAGALDFSHLPPHGLWFYVLVGVVLTALMHASSASIAIFMAALQSGLITFEMGAALVIGANIGTTGVLGLALFHTLFNVLGLILFFPGIGRLARLLNFLLPDHKTVLTVYLTNTPVEVPAAAEAALRKEILHLHDECQLYQLRLLKIDDQQIFPESLPLERKSGKRLSLEELYEDIKLLHAEIFSFYSLLLGQKLDAGEGKELERLIYASRNIMNALKNCKDIRGDLEEFEATENSYIEAQYQLFRQRLLGLCQDLHRLPEVAPPEALVRELLKTYHRLEVADRRFIQETLQAVAAQQIHDMEIASLLLANRLFTQACRLQLYGLKDLLFNSLQAADFDRVIEMRELIAEEQERQIQDPLPAVTHPA